MSVADLFGREPQVERAPALPFVKWAGGKRAVIPYLARHFPSRVETYWEPFVGGGAVFFTFADRIGRAFLSDANEELVITYQVVRDQVEDLILTLDEYQRKHMEMLGKKYADGDTFYLRIRAEAPADPLPVAARFIYLNKTCYNGLYRVNRSGGFNVPEGKYKKPLICDPDRLRNASEALQTATVRLGDFSGAQPQAGDLVYCDPPYDGCFTSYQAGGFGDSEQARLQECARVWAANGAKVILSNADTPAMRELYNGWTIDQASVKRSIGHSMDSRTDAGELVITSG